jgi:hypothetical protein
MDKLISIGTAAEVVGVSTGTLRRWKSCDCKNQMLVDGMVRP